MATTFRAVADFAAGAFVALRVPEAVVGPGEAALAAKAFDGSARSVLAGAVFFAGAVLAGAVLAGAATTGFGGHTPLASLGAAAGLISAYLKPLRAVILAFLEASP